MSNDEKNSDKLYSYMKNEFRHEIPSGHLETTDPKKQKRKLKEFFEENVKRWDDYYDKKEGNPYKHNLSILKSILENYDKTKTILDLGCGTGVPLLEFLRMGFSAKGCDFTDSAINISKSKMRENRYNENFVFKLDIEDSSTLTNEKFDIITSVGLFPHVADEKQVLQNTKRLLNKHGTVLLQFRNDLFNLFTLNAYSENFFKRLVDFDTLPDVFKSQLDKFYKKTLLAETINAQFGILSKFHNPLTIKNELFSPMGFEVKNIYFFHYHRLPPIFQKDDTKLFRKLSDEIEDPTDWRGHFLASSFIIEAELQ